MIERIKELSRVAHSAADSTYAQSPDAIWLKEYNKKFAELIVQQCMSMCDEQRAYYFGHRMASDDFIDKNMYAEGEAACDILQYKMKKYFGVEL
jgi:hypothetical protein